MKYLPWLLLAAVLAYPLLAQGTVGKVSLHRGPLKVYGIPHPDEWIDFESNFMGQPATTYTVPDGHRLTLLSVFKTPPIAQDGVARSGTISVDGNPIGSAILYGSGVGGSMDRLLIQMGSNGYAGGGDLSRSTFVRGTVLMPGQVLTVELLGGTGVTFTLRGFLEKVK